MISRRDAQERVDRIRAFREELSALGTEGALTLTPEQQEGLDAHLERTLAALSGQFDIDLTDSQRQLSWGMRVVSALGGLAFCAALFFFVYRFWGLLPLVLQVTLLVAVPLTATAAAEFAARRERTLYFTSLLCLVAFAGFVINLNVLAAIFNLTPSPGGFLAWGLFGVALAYHFGLRLPLIAGLGCLLANTACVLASFSGMAWTNAIERPETGLPGGLLLLAVPSVLRHRKLDRFPAVYRTGGLIVIYFVILILGTVSGVSFLPLTSKYSQYVYQTAGFVASAGAIAWGIRRGWASVVNVSAAFFVILLFVKLTEWWWDWMPRYLFFLLLGLIAVGLLMAFTRLRTRVRGAA